MFTGTVDATVYDQSLSQRTVFSVGSGFSTNAHFGPKKTSRYFPLPKRKD